MRLAVIIGTIFVASVGTALAQKRPVTVEDVLGLRVVGPPAISPDGTIVVYTIRQWEPSARNKGRMESRTHIWRVPVSGGPARQLTFGELGESQPQWSPDGRFVSFVAARGSTSAADDEPRSQIYLMRADGGEATALTAAKEGIRSYRWSPDSTRIAFVTDDPRTADQESAIEKRDDERVFEGDLRFSHLWAIDVASKSARRLTEGTDFTIGGEPSWSPDSTRLVVSAKPTEMLRDNRSDLYIVTTATHTVEKVTINPGPDAQPRWSPDGRLIAYVSQTDPGRPIGDGTYPSVIARSRLMLYDVDARMLRDASRADFDVDMGTPEWSPDGRRILFTTGRRAYREAYSYDVVAGAYAQLSRQKILQLGSQSRDGRVVAVTMDSPAEPGDVYVTDGSFGSFRRLTDTNPQASAFALGESEVVTWKGHDGLEIEGVVLKPVGYQAGRRYPTLVVAHGGPAGAHLDGYRVGGLEGGQVLAGQGWAIFYPNPRGSSNYGEKFLQANINDWGGGDYHDIMMGVDALIARGLADPDRLAHIGWSYGGYMTAWVITQTTRFKAAMVGAGLTNMWSMYGTNDIPNVLVTYFGGMPNASTLKLYNQRSAMSHVEKVTTPTLILHGGNDERVPVGQAYELHRALKDRGKITELIFYPREGHGIQEYYHQKDRLERIHAWITKYTLAEGLRKTTTQ
jgi:dipeptidyl aminopeptidase/acylaminoacyl peptidase